MHYYMLVCQKEIDCGIYSSIDQCKGLFTWDAAGGNILTYMFFIKFAVESIKHIYVYCRLPRPVWTGPNFVAVQKLPDKVLCQRVTYSSNICKKSPVKICICCFNIFWNISNIISVEYAFNETKTNMSLKDLNRGFYVAKPMTLDQETY